MSVLRGIIVDESDGGESKLRILAEFSRNHSAGVTSARDQDGFVLTLLPSVGAAAIL
jgi:hypothetical protein